MSDPLDHLASRVGDDPFFLACPLAEFARSRGLDDHELAAHLGCRVEDLTRLRLCRAPRPDDPGGFRSDVGAIAGRFGIEPAKLAEAVRHGQGLARVRAAAPPPERHGVMIAARDAEKKPPPEGPPS